MSADAPETANDITLAGPGGAPVAMRTLVRESNSDREIHLVASPDGMHAYMKITPGVNFSAVTPQAIAAAAAAAGVTHGLVQSGIDLLANLRNASSPTQGFLEIASGSPMRKGENGSIEFHVQPTSMEPRYDENADGAIDFKQLNLIENCFAGQRVASILPPGPGREGMDIFGAVIPAVPGEAVKVQPGTGIVVSSNGREFSSEIEGRLVFEENVLSVSPLLEISRDIDYSIGNVDFIGKVTVRGSLLDGFSINAKRGVELLGDMGAARIISEGDVKVTGGVKGKSAALISCRDLTARYLDDVTVEATGNVEVANEIMNSSVKALGRVTVTSGAIIGGEVQGFRGVEADSIGSDMGVATRVGAGLKWTEENLKGELRGKTAELMERVQSAKVLLGPLFADKGVGTRLVAEEKAMLADLVAELRDVREGLRELVEEREAFKRRDVEGMTNQINVRKMLYMGVLTRFSEVEAGVKDSVKGPLSLMQDTARGVMTTAAWKELPKPPKADAPPQE